MEENVDPVVEKKPRRPRRSPEEIAADLRAKADALVEKAKIKERNAQARALDRAIAALLAAGEACPKNAGQLAQMAKNLEAMKK